MVISYHKVNRASATTTTTDQLPGEVVEAGVCKYLSILSVETLGIKSLSPVGALSNVACQVPVEVS